jgi:sec-independent protein translocase protein TatC
MKAVGKTAESAKTKQTVREHLRELRRRLFLCLGIFIFFAIAIYFVYEPIIRTISGTLGSELYYNTPAGGFSFVMRICTTGAMVITIPFVIYNVVKFIKPAFEKILTTKRIALISIFSSLFAASGAAFAYFVILPESLYFFGGFNISGLSALINADEYLSFVTNMIVVFAMIFQVPMLMILADTIKPIPPKKMLNNEIWVVIVSLIVAIIAPFNYDILSSLIIVLPIIGLYNLSIILILSRQFIRRKKPNYNNKFVVVKANYLEEFALSDTAFMDIREDIINFEKQSPIFSALVIKNPVIMDFKVKIIKNYQTENNPKSKYLNQVRPRVKVFSDIIPRQSSHALTSQ